MIGDSAVLVDTNSDITIKGQEFRGTKGLWELLTRKKVNRKLITTVDLKKIWENIYTDKRSLNLLPTRQRHSDNARIKVSRRHIATLSADQATRYRIRITSQGKILIKWLPADYITIRPECGFLDLE